MTTTLDRNRNPELDLDIDFVRAQFPTFSEPSMRGQAFFENAGGSYPCNAVIRRLNEYYRRLKVQPYYAYRASTEAGEWMEATYARLAEYLGVASDEVHFGPSTSQNTYVLAQALRKVLKPGDEIIVTNQDHEANGGAWRRLAEGGITVNEWRVDGETGRLDPAQLDALLTERTRLVAFPHCSNVVGHINPVAELTAKARAVGAVTVVDGVAFAPHGLPNVAELGADVYLFSLYKVYGPHQGAMVVRRPLLDRLGNEGHVFNAPYPRKRLVPAGPDHAQIAAARGVAEYFDAVDAHHGGGDVAGRPKRVRELFRGAEVALLPRVLDFLTAHEHVRLLGPSNARERAPTVSFVPYLGEPERIAAKLAERGIMAAHGHFYALRLLEAMGVDGSRGVVRVSFVHYTSPGEIAQLLEALDGALSPGEGGRFE
ncbi:aminotransferase class V-fold PLP-dependent enzyme [Pendulispora albinea]|uniref:Aminotransferase class V-fold PLP-dependent enzyme n=1 Tax=Pendulispora albinea TaxID=2741071 RepID=A0ABZ2LVT1_9BACT